MVAANIEPVAHEPHAGPERVVVAAGGHRPIGMACVLPHEGEIAPIAAIGGSCALLRPIATHHTDGQIHGED